MRSDRILSCWPSDVCTGNVQHSEILGTVRQLLCPNVRGLAGAGSRDHSDRIRVATGSCVTEGGHGPHATDAGHGGALCRHPSFLCPRQYPRRRCLPGGTGEPVSWRLAARHGCLRCGRTADFGQRPELLIVRGLCIRPADSAAVPCRVRTRREEMTMFNRIPCALALILGTTLAQAQQRAPSTQVPTAKVITDSEPTRVEPVILSRSSLDEKVVALRVAPRIATSIRLPCGRRSTCIAAASGSGPRWPMAIPATSASIACRN